MTAGKIPHNALIVVADGTGARFFRNSGQENRVSLSSDGEFNPTKIYSMKALQENARAESSGAGVYRRGHVCETAGKPALSPCSRRKLCGARAHRRPTDLGPNPTVIAQGGSGFSWCPRWAKLSRTHRLRIFRRRWNPRRDEGQRRAQSRNLLATTLWGSDVRGTARWIETCDHSVPTAACRSPFASAKEAKLAAHDVLRAMCSHA